jgi:hypothetical protein
MTFFKECFQLHIHLYLPNSIFLFRSCHALTFLKNDLGIGGGVMTLNRGRFAGGKASLSGLQDRFLFLDACLQTKLMTFYLLTL